MGRVGEGLGEVRDCSIITVPGEGWNVTQWIPA